MERLGVALAEVSAQPERIGADHDGFVPYWGYRGPGLSEITGKTAVDAEMLVEALRRVKSPKEIECVQLSCDWAARAHRRMQESIVTGKTEMECYAPAAVDSLAEMVREMPGWRPRGFSSNELPAMFVAGPSTALPPCLRGGHCLLEVLGCVHRDGGGNDGQPHPL